MRKDMSKVIVERPRVGGTDRRRGRHIDNDLQVANEGMRVPHVRNYGGKQLNENLAPLLRFLTSRIGQKWDDVYSEISKNLRPTNVVQQHVRDHVKQFVKTNIVIDAAGVMWINDGRPMRLDQSYGYFWVDPRDGLLKASPYSKTYRQRKREYQQEREEKTASISRSFANGVELRKENGIWYSVSIEEVPVKVTRKYTRPDGTMYEFQSGGSAYDILRKQTVYRKYGERYYYNSKRQLNQQELRHYCVENE